MKSLSGIELSQRFYHEQVFPILSKKFDFFQKNHSACLFEHGSEVLGFDDKMSRDHDFGPRVMIFITQDIHKKFAQKMDEELRKKLPCKFEGFPTNFSAPDSEGVCLLDDNKKNNEINHKVEILEFFTYIKRYLNLKIDADKLSKGQLTYMEWLSIPQQKLLSLIGGKLFFDGLNILKPFRKIISYFPKDIWFYLISIQWKKIAEEHAFVGRTGYVGDSLGSKLTSSLIVRYIMELCFLLDKKYQPYSKWFGSAFKKLKFTQKFNMEIILNDILMSKNWKESERYLLKAYNCITIKNNEIFMTKFKSHKQFHTRPFQVSYANEFYEEIMKQLKQMKTKFAKDLREGKVIPVGNIDQLCYKNTLALENNECYSKYKRFIEIKNVMEK